MIKAVEVEATGPYVIWLRYEDGTEGEVDLSGLAGRGIFEAWEDRQTFEDVGVGDFGQITWGGDLELDPYALYMRLASREPHELFPNLAQTRTGFSDAS